MRKIINNTHNLYRFYQKRRTWMSMFSDIKKGNYGLSALTVIVLIAAIVYMLMPADFLPDFIPLIGWIDDSIVGYLLIKQMRKELKSYERKKSVRKVT